MAQYTPNFNLYEPDSTDDFADFRTEFNNNMNIIDQNLGGGGGSGGHTIIDENGQSMTQRTGLEFTGNVQVTDDSVNDKTIVDILGGGGNVYGAFVDTDRVIQSSTTLTNDNPTTYTATEDCAVIVGYYGTATDGYIKIDGVNASTVYVPSNSPLYLCETVYVRKGQVVTMKSVQNNGAYTVYGLTQGTNGIFAPVIYSDNERVIGVWRDNKPLYQKTVVLTSGFSTNMTVSHGISNLERVVYVQGTLNNDIIPFTAMENNTFMGQWSSSITGMNVSNFKIYIGSDLVQYVSQIAVTLRYTKTTDVAGSGNWNTDGVPTHHYSTSEQVVGTWIDGKPIYERTWDFSGSPVMLSYANWVNSGISAGENIKAIMSAELKYGAVILTSVEVGVNVDGYPVGFQKLDNLNTRGVEYCTLIYTKTTD